MAKTEERQRLAAAVSGTDTFGKAQPMTITFSDNLSQASAAPNTGTLEFKSDANPSTDGQSFGQLMSDLIQAQTESSAEIADKETQLAQQPGQEIAVPFSLNGLAAELGTPAEPQNAVTLKAVILGPHLSVITPETSPPDSQSLEAFARAQGLDENAVHWLFGGHAGTQPATLSATLTTNPSSANVVTTGTAFGSTENPGNVQGSPPAIQQAIQSSGFTGQTTATPQTPALSNQAPATPQTPALSDQAPASPQAPALPGQAPATPQTAAATGQFSPAANGQTTVAATSLLGHAMSAAQALWAMADDTGQAKKPTATPSTEEALPLQMLRMPPPAAVWMQRNVLQSVLQQTESAPKEADISLSELDLGADWGGETLRQLLVTEGGAHSTGTHGTAYANFAARWDAQANLRNDTTNTSGPAPDLPDTNARSENIQNLAEKMGQAVGQRILSEMERGQWHLKLQLRPATLGHIEIEMRMRSGEFDAIFTAPNAVTRDLLQDGMSKLRETLSQMGMDVANIHVGGGQTGQSGGDPTPGFSKGKPTQAQESGQDTTPEIARAPRVKDPSEGLDVLV
jgi:flagellar hook-length control protein FliK